MKQVIEKIQGLYSTLGDRLAEVDTKRKELDARGVKLKEKEDISDTRAKDLNTREIAVKKIEDVKELADMTEIAIKKLAADNDELQKSKDNLANYHDQVKKENREYQKTLTDGIAANEAKEKALNEKELKLKEKAKNLRAEIIASIK